jgi:hypothetical protein
VRHALNTIGFIWKLDDYRLSVFLDALEEYQRIYKDIDVPTTFCIPNVRNAKGYYNWTEEMYGFRLGHNFRAYNNKKLSNSQRSLILKRFPTFFNVSSNNFFDTSEPAIFITALTEYHDKFNSSDASVDYIMQIKGIPNPYPLGKVLARVKKEGIDFLLKSVHRELRSSKKRTIYSVFRKLKMTVPNSHSVKFERICRALLCHQNLYGDMLVPRYFVVPKDDSWPVSVIIVPIFHL